MNYITYIIDKIQEILFLLWYKRHLKKRIEKNNFGREKNGNMVDGLHIIENFYNDPYDVKSWL